MYAATIIPDEGVVAGGCFNHSFPRSYRVTFRQGFLGAIASVVQHPPATWTRRGPWEQEVVSVGQFDELRW